MVSGITAIPVFPMKLSTRTSDADLRMALELGADDFVPKPISTPLLIHRLGRVLGP